MRILIAEDDLEMLKLLVWLLRREGHEVVECRDGGTLMEKIGLRGASQQPCDVDLIISDNRMPGASGLDVLEAASALDHHPPMILITAFPDQTTFARARQLGVVSVVAKPFDIDDLLFEVRHVTNRLKNPRGRSSGRGCI